MLKDTIARWHAHVESGTADGLDELLADDAVFHSPVVHTPQEGKAIVTLYLTGANHVLKDSNFTYVREVLDGDTAVLEFTAEIDGIHINGVDMIRVNDEGKISDFKVMIRPLKAVNMLHRKMGEALEQFSGK